MLILLRNQLGIRVIVVEQGAFRTDFAGRSLQGAATRIADYDETVGPRRKGTTARTGPRRAIPRGRRRP